MFFFWGGGEKKFCFLVFFSFFHIIKSSDIIKIHIYESDKYIFKNYLDKFVSFGKKNINLNFSENKLDYFNVSVSNKNTDDFEIIMKMNVKNSPFYEIGNPEFIEEKNGQRFFELDIHVFKIPISFKRPYEGYFYSKKFEEFLSTIEILSGEGCDLFIYALKGFIKEKEYNLLELYNENIDRIVTFHEESAGKNRISKFDINFIPIESVSKNSFNDLFVESYICEYFVPIGKVNNENIDKYISNIRQFKVCYKKSTLNEIVKNLLSKISEKSGFRDYKELTVKLFYDNEDGSGKVELVNLNQIWNENKKLYYYIDEFTVDIAVAKKQKECENFINESSSEVLQIISTGKDVLSNNCEILSNSLTNIKNKLNIYYNNGKLIDIYKCHSSIIDKLLKNIEKAEKLIKNTKKDKNIKAKLQNIYNEVEKIVKDLSNKIKNSNRSNIISLFENSGFSKYPVFSRYDQSTCSNYIYSTAYNLINKDKDKDKDLLNEFEIFFGDKENTNVLSDFLFNSLKDMFSRLVFNFKIDFARCNGGLLSINGEEKLKEILDDEFLGIYYDRPYSDIKDYAVKFFVKDGSDFRVYKVDNGKYYDIIKSNDIIKENDHIIIGIFPRADNPLRYGSIEELNNLDIDTSPKLLNDNKIISCIDKELKIKNYKVSDVPKTKPFLTTKKIKTEIDKEVKKEVKKEEDKCSSVTRKKVTLSKIDNNLKKNTKDVRNDRKNVNINSKKGCCCKCCS